MTLKANLHLGKITLKNYRTYKNTTIVELSRDPERTITVIEGQMGKGKTTILNAVYWCLYGNFRPTGNPSDENILNNDVLHALKLGDEDDTYVEVHLYEEDELRYKIKRNVHFVKKQESSRLVTRKDVDGRLAEGIEVTSTVEFSHLLKLSEPSEWRVYIDPVQARDAILSIFPEPLSLYFLFDAELLDNFFSVGTKSNVKNGIEKISGLPVMDDAIKHIKKTYADVLEDIHSPKTASIREQIFIIGKSITSNENIISEEKQRLQEITDEIDSIRSYLRNNDEKSVQAKEREAEALDVRRKELRSELNTLEKEMNDWLLYCNTIARLHATMEDSLDKCDRWEKEGKIPIAVSSQALNNILRADPSICICGTHLKTDSKERAHMQELLEKNTADSPIIQNITTGRGHWDDMVSETTYQSLNEKLQVFRSKRERLRSEYDKKHANFKEIQHGLQKHDKEQIRMKSQRLSVLENQRDESNAKKAVAEDKNSKASLELELKNRELDKLTKEEFKYQSHYNRRELAKTIENILKQCRDDLIEQLRSTVAEKTTNYFLRLVSRNDFSKVEIGSDYTVTAYGPTGYSKGLSAGQTCCLALSYIAAIREIAEKNYFMVIDSPLHNIDQGERIDIAKNLPKFIPGTQITLLVQDQEYVGSVIKAENRKGIPSVRDILRENNSLWKEYKLTFHETPETNSYNTLIEEMKD